MRISFKLLMMSELVLLGATLALLIPVRDQMRRQVVEDLQSQLHAIAATAALEIDGDLHKKISAAGDADGAEFAKLRDQLKRIRDVNKVEYDHIYTFYRDGDKVRYAVMTHDQPFVGDPYTLQPAMLRVFENGETVVTDLYEDEYGEWISAYAPIRDSGGVVVGLLEVDHKADEYFRRYRAVTMLTVALGVIVLAFSSLLGWLALNRVVIRPMGEIHKGMLALGRRDFSHRVVLHTDDEFQELAGTLNSIAEQLDVARVIQLGFFPKSFPKDPHYRIAGGSEPCDATGGDYYDVFKLPSGCLALVLADVSGHGLGASLLMSACRSVLRALAETNMRPGELVDRLDLLLEEDLTDGRFITLFYGVLSANGAFTYSNAGHGPAMISTADGIEHLRPHRTPLGVRIELDADDLETTISLAEGDRIFLASDGVTETISPDGEWLGNEPVENIVGNREITCAEVLRSIDRTVRRHRGPEAQADDVTVVCVDVVKVTPREPGAETNCSAAADSSDIPASG